MHTDPGTRLRSAAHPERGGNGWVVEGSAMIPTVFRRRPRSEPTPEQIDGIRATYEALVQPLRSDVRQFIDPTWNVSFRFWDGSWWFDITTDIGEEMNGSFNGHLIAVACYVEEYLSDEPSWPRCRTHSTPLHVRADGREHILWSCDGPPRHAVRDGRLAEVRAG